MVNQNQFPKRPIRKKRRKQEKKFGNNNRKKLLIVFIVLLIFICVLIGRLLYINLSSSDTYARIVMAQMDYDSKSIPFKRGDIKDRNGTVLATSEKVYNLVLDPYVVLNSNGDCEKPTAEAIEEYFGIDKETVYDALDENPDSRYIVLAKKLDYDTVKAYQDFMNSEDEQDQKDSALVKGIWFEEEYLRQYPYDSLAASLIGFTVSGNQGTWGLEGYYNDMLNGTNGREYGYLSDESDFERTTVAAINGYNVVSTIDLNIQRIVEKYVAQLGQERGSKHTGVIVANPNTGEILAMADSPTFNLNSPRDLSAYYSEEEIANMSDEEETNALYDVWRNFCVSDTFEAGSTMKPLTIGAALDENKVSTGDSFLCDGGEDLFDGVGTQHIPCHYTYGHGTTTLQEAIMWSCNDALMQIGNRIGTTDMLKYHRLYGFGRATGIDLPGEAGAESLVFNESTMGSFELATSAFGQGFNLTMVQMIAAFSSIVNGGHYYQPHVVKEITTESGHVVKSFDKVLVRNTLSKETCDWLKEAMHQTVADDGVYTTGTAARVDGYTIGGKTGTAEKVPRGTGKYVVSFIGFAPVEDPQVVVYVVIDELQDNQEDSSAPTKMAGDILKEVLPYLQIFPNNGEGSEETSGDPGNYQWGAEPETNEDGTPIENEDTEDEDIEDNEIVDEAGDGYVELE
ncbi:stage V sporulation protein D (sporulation-specific penicillin-binding protein) [Frisingicoccus caecimuris]|uniref:Stage V sporulation protein D (Sporulation-specific penicillin-binding protein) n=1 Tax=Frisingicoccus caecimuris TaxID=1796636 RepID=A0A4R2LYB9_9FIRM|nr:stage V sporulation protein D (sporulation-specific penicillin-binding protein) [Frisingicoccus caecimuris]